MLWGEGSLTRFRFLRPAFLEHLGSFENLALTSWLTAVLPANATSRANTTTINLAVIVFVVVIIFFSFRSRLLTGTPYEVSSPTVMSIRPELVRKTFPSKSGLRPMRREGLASRILARTALVR